MLKCTKINPAETKARCESQTTLLVLRGGGQSPTMKLRSSFRNLLRPRIVHSATNSAPAATANEPADEPAAHGDTILSRYFSIDRADVHIDDARDTGVEQPKQAHHHQPSNHRR